MALPKKNKSNISNSSFITCKKLFEELDWDIADNESSLFQKFLKRYDKLETKEQKDVFLDLTRKYTIVELEDYLPLLKNILISKYFKENTDRQSILLFPLIPAKAIQDIKSSSFLIYLFFHYSFLHNDILNKKKFSVICNYQKLFIEANHKNHKNLLLIDDYIGSGQTAIESLENIFQVVDSKNHSFTKITILCLYINELGLKKLHEYINSNNLEVDIIYYKKTKYSIGGCENILENINLKEPYNGHGGCGDLITLIRTPNNTIPLFHKFIPKNPAPFHRNSK
ncbi:MAG: hypothetical protein N4A40_10620 [Tissierellales bacterium]|jgi:ABC-type multidrug transport system fused ATPase/permease subunit|nr:hypothetical protein [Tissierellales bacterium]